MSDEPSPAERFEAYLGEVEREAEPLPERLEQSWSDRAIMALIVTAGFMFCGGVVARTVG